MARGVRIPGVPIWGIQNRVVGEAIGASRDGGMEGVDHVGVCSFTLLHLV